MLGALASDLPAMTSHHVPSPPPDPGFPTTPPLPGLTRLAGIRARLRAAPRLAWAALCRRYPYHGIDTLLVVANCSSRPADLPLDALPGLNGSRLVLGTHAGRRDAVLEPWESRILRLAPAQREA